jgi:hypothetical protein
VLDVELDAALLRRQLASALGDNMHISRQVSAARIPCGSSALHLQVQRAVPLLASLAGALQLIKRGAGAADTQGGRGLRRRQNQVSHLDVGTAHLEVLLKSTPLERVDRPLAWLRAVEVPRLDAAAPEQRAPAIDPRDRLRRALEQQRRLLVRAVLQQTSVELHFGRHEHLLPGLAKWFMIIGIGWRRLHACQQALRTGRARARLITSRNTGARAAYAAAPTN